MSTLDREIATYDELLPELLRRAGQFAVIKHNCLVGVFADYEEALLAGYECGIDEAFLVRQITETQRPHIYPRGIALACQP